MKKQFEGELGDPECPPNLLDLNILANIDEEEDEAEGQPSRYKMPEPKAIDDDDDSEGDARELSFSRQGR